MMYLHNYCSLSFGEVLIKRSEGKARSGSKSSSLEFASPSSHEVPAMWKLKIEARSRKMMCLSHRFAPIVLRQTLTPFVGEIVQAHFPLPLHLLIITNE